MLKFTTTDSAGQLHGIKILIYGRSGVGKTTLASTVPDVLILSAEAGVLSLRDKAIPMIQITTVVELSEAYHWITTNPHAKGFKTIFLDSITEIAEQVLSNAKLQVKDSRQAYGELIEKMNMLVRSFRDLPGKNVVMLAKQESHLDEVSKMTMFGPAMPGSKVSQQLPYLFDEVFRLGVGKTPDGTEYRFLQTQPDLQYEAKDRSGVLDAIEPPNLSHIFNKILTTPRKQ